MHQPQRLTMARKYNDSGQALVTVAFGLVVILGFLGLAMDVGYLRVMKRHVQRAADAAALAGAAEVSYCSGTSNCSALQKAAQSAVTENGMGSSALATQCGTATGSLIVTVNNPPCYLSTNDPNHGNSSYVEVVVSETEPLMFAKIFGINTATVTARGEATSGGSTNCMYLLDRTDSETLYVTGGSRMQLPSCSMYIDSSSPSAVTVSGGSSITASSISIVGSDSVTGGSSITPANPATGASVVADPLARLPKPSYTPCTVKGSTYIPTNGTVILAGSYCGGITVNGGNTVSFGGGNYVIAGGLQIGNGATVTFGSGMYVIEGGGMSLNGGTTNSGSGLTFFLTGTSTFPYGPFTISNGANATFSAPTSGTYTGILFFEDSSAYGVSTSSTSSFIGGSTSYFQGALYFPTTPVIYSGGTLAQYTIIDAYSVTVSGGSQAVLNSNYSSLQGGSPIKGSGSVLVE